MIDHLLVLCRYLPDRTKSSGEVRFDEILRHLARRSRRVTAFVEDAGNRPLFPEMTVRPMSALADEPPDADLAFLEFWFMDVYVPVVRERGIPIVLDSVDVEFLRRERERPWVGAGEGYFHLEKAREIEAYRAADQVWAVSDRDAEHIRSFARDLAVVPNVFEPPATIPGFAEREGVSFVGSYSHQPNVDGLRWYRDEILPRVRDLPHVIIGHGAPEDLRSLPGFVGGVPCSTERVTRARVSIAPLRYGAGLKGKVLEAMACGTPVVTTSIGDEGYDASEEGAAIRADDPERFADAIRRLATDAELWARASARARRLAQRYSREAVGPLIDRALESVLSTKSGAR